MSVLIPGGSPGAPSLPLLLKHPAYCCRAASVLSAKGIFSSFPDSWKRAITTFAMLTSTLSPFLCYYWLCVKARLTIIFSFRSGIGLPGPVLHGLSPLVDVSDVLGWCTKFESAEHHLLSRSRYQFHPGCSGLVSMDVLERVSCRGRQDELPREHSCVSP